MRIFLAIIASFIIVACGGGGGGGAPAPTPTPTPVPIPRPIPENFVVTSELAELGEVTKTIQYTLKLNSVLDRRIVINYEATNDTAQSGQDFIATKGTATIDIGEISTIFSVRIIDDNVVEQTEQFSIVLSDLKVYKREDGEFILDNNSTLKLPTAKLATVKIRDNDSAELSVSYNPNNGEIIEGEALLVSVTSTNRIEVKGGLKLNYTGVPSSQFIISGDRIASGESSTDLRLLARADGLTEGTETFSFNLAVIDNQAVFGRDGAITVLGSSQDITVIDRLTLGFIAPVKQEILENGTGELIFKIGILSDTGATHNAAIDLDATTSLTGGSAEAGDLKTLTGITVTIEAGETSADLRIAITDLVVDDNLVELRENFFIELEKGANFLDALAISTEQNRVEVEIISEDRATLSILGDSERIINEGEVAELEISSSNPIDIGEDLLIAYSDIEMGATRITDYSFNVATITIKQGESRGDLVLESKFDKVEEATEGVKIQIDTIQNSVLRGQYADYVSIADASVSTITISDRNTLRLVTNTVIEQAGLVAITLELDRAVADSTTEVAYEVTTDTAGALDFDATNGTVTIKAGETSITFEIVIKDDEIVEKTETFEVILTGLKNTDATGNTIASPVTIVSERNKVEIRDNDEAQISLSTSSLEIAEGDSTILTIETSKKIAEDVTIDIAVSGTATAGEDYEALASQVILAKDTTSVTINLATLSDDAIEGDEIVLVTLTGVVNTGYKANALTIDQAKKETIATIKDEDGSVTLSIESRTGSSAVSIEEGNSGTKALLFVVKSDKPISEAVTINFAVVTKEGSARDSLTSDPDFVQATINDSISGGNTKELRVNIYGDTRVERDETFDIALEITSSTAGITVKVDNVKSKLQVTITDKDKAIFRFVKNGTTTGIEGGNITLEVMTDSVIEDVEIDLTSRATVNNIVGQYNRAVAADYSKLTQILTFSDAIKTQRIEYNIVDDGVVELVESFLVMLEAVGNDKADTSLAVATVNIEVDRKDTTRLSINSGSKEEGDSGNKGELVLIASLTNPISAPINFTYKTANSTGANAAEGGIDLGTNRANPVDYIITNKGATISNASSTSLTIEINEDKTVETAETFRVILENLVLGNYYDATQVSFATGETEATATIKNDDEAVLNLSVAGGAEEPEIVGQTSDLVFIIIVADGVVADEDITLNFHTSEFGTATASEDYIAVNRSVTIPAGANSTTQIVKIKGDNLVENLETLISHLSNPSAGDISDFVRLGRSPAAIGIIIDDKIDFRIEVPNGITEGTEATKDIQVTIVIDKPEKYQNGGNIVVNYEATLDNSEIKLGDIGRASKSDFEATSGSFTFSPGSTSDSFKFSIVRDELVEREETLKLMFSIDRSGQFLLGHFIISNSGTDERTITIQNDDTAILSIADASQNENAGAMQFEVTSDLELAEDVTIDIEISTENVTTSSNDYTALQNYTLTRDGDTNFNVIINNDNITEANETFIVSIALATSDQIKNSANIISTDIATGTIQNDDTAIFRLIAPDATNEGNSSSKPIRFILDTTSDIADYVTFSASVNTTGGGTASVDSDFTSTAIDNLTLTDANSFTNNFSVNVNGDNLVEPDETIEVSATLNAIDQTGVMARIESSPARATITNDDIASITISAIDSLVTEPATSSDTINVSFQITSSNPIANDVTIDYRLSGTATPGADYNAPSGNVALSANTTTVDIAIEIKGDDIYEIDETLIVTLSNPTAVSVDLGDSTTATVTIQNDFNDKPEVSLAAVNPSIAEGAIATFTVSIDPTTDFDYRFQYKVTAVAGSGISNDDFENITLDGAIDATLSANNSSIAIIIETSDDTEIELNEAFMVSISDSVDTVDIITSTAQVTINNNDLGEISNTSATVIVEGVNFSWTNPDSNIFDEVTIAYIIGSDAPANCSGGRQLGDITNYIVTNLANHNNYSFRICARSTDGNYSDGAVIKNIDYTVADSNGNGLIDIANAEQLNNVRYNSGGTSYITSDSGTGNTVGCPANGCSGYELINDIDLSGYANWDPIIGTFGRNREFSATFDGNNNIIRNLIIDRTTDNIGLFRVLLNATVSNLKIMNIKIQGGNTIGALAGGAFDSNLSNIELIGDDSQASSDAEIIGNVDVGALVGRLRGTITGSSSSLTVTQIVISDSLFDFNIGGLVGYFISGTIVNSHSSGSVFGILDNVGGLVGLQAGGNISQSSSSGNVSGSGTWHSNYGGLVGMTNFGGNISQSWASGNVSSNGTLLVNYGGLVGAQRGIGNISQSWASGNVTSSGSGNSGYGGLVGVQERRFIGQLDKIYISQSWASGNVTSSGAGNSDYGGLVGRQRSTGHISQSWASGNVTSDVTNLNYGGLVGNSNGNIIGRNYQLDSGAGTGVDLANDDGIGESFILADATALANLSGATSDGTSDWGTNSNWHAGFDISDPTDDIIDLETRFCDIDGEDGIDGDMDGEGERTQNNSVWVMPSDPINDEFPTGISDNVPAPTTNTARNPAMYYQIPAIRCIGTTPAERRDQY